MEMNDIKYSKKMLAFLDILGFEKLVNQSKSNPELIKKITDMLNLSRQFALSFSDISPSNNPLKIPLKVLKVESDQYRYRVFSDTIVISAPNMSHDDMYFLFLSVMRYQYLMWKEFQTFLRGSIVFGDIYEDGDVVFGPALIDAYHLESCGTTAVWPRVLVDRSLLDKTTTEERRRDFLEFLTPDDTPITYLDYLRQLFHLFVVAENHRITGQRPADFGAPADLFKDHKEAILAQCRNALKEEDENKRKKIIRKYAELSKYHNSTVDRLRQATKDLTNNNNLVRDFFDDRIESDRAARIGAAYTPKYSAEEHSEQSDMLNVLGAVTNGLLEERSPDILRTPDIVVVGQTFHDKLESVIRALCRETPQKLLTLDKALQETMIDIDSLSLNA